MSAGTDREGWVRSVAEGAASLDERLRDSSASLPGAEPMNPTPEVVHALAAWTKSVSAGDTVAFRRRLSWDGLDEDLVAAGFSRGPLAGEELPRWVHWLGRFERACAERALPPRGTEGPETTRLLATLPFPQVAAAVADAAVKCLADRYGVSLIDGGAIVVDTLEAQLVRELSRASELALHESFQAFCAERATATPEPEPMIAAFTDQLLRAGIREFLSTYPALARQWAVLCETWVESTRQLMERLSDDRERISSALGADRLGAVVRVRAGLSDRHGGGRRVVGLEFESGVRVVYKPRNVGMDVAFAELCRWLRQEGLEVAPRAMDVVPRDGYGWTTFIEQEDLVTEAEARAYFRHAGSLMCIAHLLNGRDLHMENIIATSSGPVLIDAEMLFQPRTDDLESASCLESGLLSLIDVDARGIPLDTGGLRGAGGSVSPEPE